MPLPTSAATVVVPTRLTSGGHTGVHKLHHNANATLGSADVVLSVKLPEGMDEDEWIAARTVVLLEELESVVFLVTEFCTETTCPCMNAGKGWKYCWADEIQTKPTELSAPAYMHKLLEYSYRVIKEVPEEGEFPPGFRDKIATVLKRFFRVYAHAYIVHFKEIVSLGIEAHLNLYLKHYMAFVKEFNLVEQKEFKPMEQLFKKWDLERDSTVAPIAEEDSSLRSAQ